MQLADFPDEIFHHIISEIVLNSDLAKVALVSHRFKTLTEPFLYRNILLDAEQLEERQPGTKPTLKWTDQLIANLRAHPELGRCTTAFSLRVTHFLYYQDQPHINIISRMPKLRKLSYDPPPLQEGPIPTENKDLMALRLDFSHVTNHYDAEGSSWWKDGVPLRIVAMHLWHPSLRKLQAEKVFFTAGFEHDPWLFQRRMQDGRSPVEDLRFLDCFPRIEDGVLMAFIASIKRVKRFVLEIKSPGDSPPARNDPPTKIDVKSALHAHHRTIEELALSTSDYAPDLMQFSGSFIRWTALKRLAVPVPGQHTMLHQVLPPQLEELQLEKRLWIFPACKVLMEYDVFAEKDLGLLWEFSKKKRACVPALKRLIWWLQYPSGQNSSGGKLRFHVSTLETCALELFGDVGVKFEVVSTPFFKETPFGKRLYEW